MRQDELFNRISELEREIAILPEGSIAKKTINDKVYYYHRVSHDGKKVKNMSVLKRFLNSAPRLKREKR